MSRHDRLRALTMLVLLGAWTLPAAPAANADTPTFTRDVAPIFYENCVTCHRPGEVAPMSLITYRDVRPWSRAIKARVVAGEMPPWHADPAYGRFENDRRLSERDKDTIARWVDAGAPEGDPADLPPAPQFTEGWAIGAPDAIVSMPKPFEVPAEGEVKYQYFAAPTGFTEDKWVQAIEARPGAREVVHHILVFARDPRGESRRPAACVWSGAKAARARGAARAPSVSRGARKTTAPAASARSSPRWRRAPIR